MATPAQIESAKGPATGQEASAVREVRVTLAEAPRGGRRLSGADILAATGVGTILGVGVGVATTALLTKFIDLGPTAIVAPFVATTVAGAVTGAISAIRRY